MNLDTVDKKLITYLYHNFREPLSKIAKATNLSRDQVEYRIKKYEKEGLIIKF
ncbi:MAG: Lrp/AsnC family transcriptional regulator [Nanoarchaeota archaeon]|jgi:DNA-binding Lrp family transcriptional regulator|nr:Lrp/AsnC family transcriptional regulator [Nanoarchaeota archaeon]